MLDKLYREYGELMVQAEVTQARINECKRLIAEELNKKVAPVQNKSDDIKPPDVSNDAQK